MKKILIISTFIVFSFLLAACKIDFAPILSQLKVTFQGNDTYVSVTQDFTLTWEVDSKNDVSITWESSNNQVISIASEGNGIVHRGAAGTPNQTVTLKATASVKKKSEVKEFVLVVVSLPEITKLATPVVSNNDWVVSWPAVPNVANYAITLNGEAQTPQTATTLSLIGKDLEYPLTVTVQALSGSSDYLDSEIASIVISAAPPVKEALATPAELDVDNGELTWKAVANASSYLVYLNNEQVAATTPSLNLLDEEVTLPLTIKVQAISNGEHLNSELSEALTIEEIAAGFKITTRESETVIALASNEDIYGFIITLEKPAGDFDFSRFTVELNASLTEEWEVEAGIDAETGNYVIAATGLNPISASLLLNVITINGSYTVADGITVLLDFDGEDYVEAVKVAHVL